MASYLQRYDPNSYLTKGYDLPSQQILGAISNRTQFFILSAQKIKNEYDSTFDFNLTNEANKSSLRTQKEEVNEQLKSLTKKDLSISDNSSSIRKLFKPIMQDINYLKDEALTNKISSGFQQAQSDLKKNGADHYNMKSIQVLNETLQDWQNDDPSNIDKYTSDTLGTTYQPYDPKVDKEFLKTIQDRVKNGKIKIDVKDGAGNIISQEIADINSLQAQEFIREIRPQQQVIQDQLDAKLYGNRLRKSSPQEQAQLLSHVEGIRKYNIDKQVSFIEMEKHKLEANYALLPKEDQEKQKTQYEKIIETYTDGVKKAKGMYDTFDNEAYFDNNKRQVSQSQLETLLNQRSVNALIDGMGLENNSRTIKSDVAYWNQRNLEYNYAKLDSDNKYRQADLAIKAGKAGKDANGNPLGENPNIRPASDVTSLGTEGLNLEDKEQVIGEETQKIIKGGIEAKKSEVAENVFSQLGVMVNSETGFGTENFYKALSNTSEKHLGPLVDRMAGGSETNKKLIYSLIQEGVQQVNGKGHMFKESTLPHVSIKQAKVFLKAALDNPEIFDKAVKKAAIDTGNFSVIDELAYQKSQLSVDEKDQETKYGKAYKTSASILGIPRLNNESFDKLKYYDVDQYMFDIIPELKKNGATEGQIKGLSEYLKGKNDDFQKENNPNVRAMYTEMGAGKISTPKDGYGLPGSPLYFANKWKDYQKRLNKNLANVSRGASNYNTVAYEIVDKTISDKPFNPDIHFNSTTFRQIIQDNVASANIAGKTNDGEVVEKMKRLVREYPNVITGFSAYSDGRESFIIPTINRTTETNKALSDVGLDPEDFTKTKIYIDKPGVNEMRLKPQSEATSDFMKGKTFGATGQTGRKFSFWNIGNGTTPTPSYDGSLGVVGMRDGVFSVKFPTLSTFVKTPIDVNGTILEQTILAGGADKVAGYVYHRDAEAKRVIDILERYGIDYKDEKNISWNQLPQKAKDELRKNTLQFKNLRD